MRNKGMENIKQRIKGNYNYNLSTVITRTSCFIY